MSAQDEQLTEFERRSREVLEESVLRIDGRVRSRLNQARQAAIAEASQAPSRILAALHVDAHRRCGGCRGARCLRALAGASAWVIRSGGSGRAGVEDLDLLADSDALDLVSDQPDTGQFYEWRWINSNK